MDEKNVCHKIEDCEKIVFGAIDAINKQPISGDSKEFLIDHAAFYLKRLPLNESQDTKQFCEMLWKQGLGKGFRSRGNPYSIGRTVYCESYKETADLDIDPLSVLLNDTRLHTEGDCPSNLDLYILTLEELVVLAPSAKNEIEIVLANNNGVTSKSLANFIKEEFQKKSDNNYKQHLNFIDRLLCYVILRKVFRYYPRSGSQFGCDYVVYTTPTPDASHSKYLAFINYQGSPSSLVRTGSAWHKSILLIQKQDTADQPDIMALIDNLMLKRMEDEQLVSKCQSLADKYDFIVLFRVIAEKRILPHCSSASMFIDDNRKNKVLSNAD